MFTGLVERTGIVSSISEDNSKTVWTLKVDPGRDYDRDHGASIAINGVCLSEVGTDREGILTFHVSPETLNKTSLHDLTNGSRVNLERAMKPSDRFGGHIVLGHVDGTGLVSRLELDQGFWNLDVKIPINLAKYLVSKGSIAIDGVSLTINFLKDEHDHTIASFMLIPITWQTTRFSELKVGARVNLEVDILAKHIERLTNYNVK